MKASPLYKFPYTHFNILFLWREFWYLHLVKTITLSLLHKMLALSHLLGIRGTGDTEPKSIGRYSLWSNTAHRLPLNNIMSRKTCHMFSVLPINFSPQHHKYTFLISSFDGLENRTKTGHNNMTSHHHDLSTWFQDTKFSCFHICKIGIHCKIDVYIHLGSSFFFLISPEKLLLNWCFLYNPYSLRIKEICHFKHSKRKSSQKKVKKPNQTAVFKVSSLVWAVLENSIMIIARL